MSMNDDLFVTKRRALPRRRAGGTTAIRTYAMVNVDVSPSVILGVGLIGSGTWYRGGRVAVAAAAHSFARSFARSQACRCGRFGRQSLG